MRLALILLWAAVALALLLPLLRRGRPSVPGADRHELVKDPVCQTYVVRARAVERTEAGVRRYFCSPECARRFASGLRG